MLIFLACADIVSNFIGNIAKFLSYLFPGFWEKTGYNGLTLVLRSRYQFTDLCIFYINKDGAKDFVSDLNEIKFLAFCMDNINSALQGKELRQFIPLSFIDGLKKHFKCAKKGDFEKYESAGSLEEKHDILQKFLLTGNNAIQEKTKCIKDLRKKFYNGKVRDFIKSLKSDFQKHKTGFCEFYEKLIKEGDEFYFKNQEKLNEAVGDVEKYINWLNS